MPHIGNAYGMTSSGAPVAFHQPGLVRSVSVGREPPPIKGLNSMLPVIQKPLVMGKSSKLSLFQANCLSGT